MNNDIAEPSGSRALVAARTKFCPSDFTAIVKNLPGPGWSAQDAHS